MKWRPEGVSPLPHSWYSASLIYKSHIWFHSSQERGRRILILVLPRYEASTPILLKKFLAKILSWGVGGEMTILHQSHPWSHDSHMWSIGDFGTHYYVADCRFAPKQPLLMTFLWLRSWIGQLARWEDGFGRHLVSPSPRQGILLFCLILLNYMTWGIFWM